MKAIKDFIYELPENLKRCCEFVINSEKFNIWPASLDKHQAYSGGLLQHTTEVTNICINTAKDLKANKDILIVSAIYHDYGKVYDYRINESIKSINSLNIQDIKNNLSLIPLNFSASLWEKAPDRFLARHPVRSYHEWMVQADKNNINEELKLNIAHCILAHHGRLEWNSPVEPQTIEATILHHSDVISGRFL